MKRRGHIQDAEPLTDAARDGSPVVTLSGVSLRYPGDSGVEALCDINLEINRREFLCVLGPSGCGKSTLLRIIAGMRRPTEGAASMLGAPITGPDWRRAVVFQSPTLYPWLSTYDNIAFGPKMRGLPGAEIAKRTEKYISLVGLTEFAHSRPYELSGGMKQRAALARVLVNEPSMILMDEPLGALDALTRANMQDLVRRIWMEAGSTVLFITHDVNEALSLGTRIAVMSHRPGTIAESFRADFTEGFARGEGDDIRYSPPYREMRKTLLALIGANTNRTS